MQEFSKWSKYSEKQRVREAKNLIRFRIRLNIHIHNHLITAKVLCHTIQIKISIGVERRELKEEEESSLPSRLPSRSF